MQIFYFKSFLYLYPKKMKTLNKEQYQSVYNYYQQIKDTGIDFNIRHLTTVKFGEFDLKFTADFDSIGIIEVKDIWLYQGGTKYLVPSIMIKQITQMVNRLGKPLNKIDLSGSPLQLLQRYGKSLY